MLNSSYVLTFAKLINAPYLLVMQTVKFLRAVAYFDRSHNDKFSKYYSFQENSQNFAEQALLFLVPQCKFC